MASLLERLKYIIEDIFGKKTYAESQRDKYKKVVRNLEKELKKTDNFDFTSAIISLKSAPSFSTASRFSLSFVTKVSLSFP